MTMRVSTGLEQSGSGVGVLGLRSQESGSDGKKRHRVVQTVGFEGLVNVGSSILTNVPPWWGMLVVGEAVHDSRNRQTCGI